LRGVRYAKRLVERVAGHPHNPVVFIDDQRHAITILSGDFPIDEKVLQLLPSAKPDGAETVAWAAMAHGQAAWAELSTNTRHRAIARNCTCVDVVGELGRNGAAGVGQQDLSWNRQRNFKKVR